jgi:predicted metal-dependent peptidase
MSNAKERLTKARAGLILDAVFFGSLALRLKLIEDISIPTMATDGTVIRYSPKFVEGLFLEEVKGVLCHEVMHCALQHHTRRQGRDPVKWNMAGDYAINPTLKDSGFTLPSGHLDNPAYHGKSADEIYSLLPDDLECFDGLGGDPGGCGAVEDAKEEGGRALTEAELSEVEQEWKVAIIQAAQQAKACGKLPAGLERLLDDVLNPKVDWRTVLRQFVETSARSDYNWVLPNKRYIQQGIYLPCLKSDELGHVVVAVDTSGSISQQELNQFAGEMSSILEEYQDAKITVLYCDSEIAGVEEFASDDLPLQLHPKGGGGTDFSKVFLYVEEQGIEPVCLVYLTDLWCDSFGETPEYPVLWVATSDREVDVPFGEIIRIAK